jgi:hypothetical protein
LSRPTPLVNVVRMAADASVPLSRWRALLARSRSPATRVEALLLEPAAAAIVPRLPVQDLYGLAHAAGLADALDVLRRATPAQIRGCIDLDAWQGDELDDRRALAWLDTLAELGPAAIGAVVRALDAELVALLLVRHVHVHDRSLGEGPAPDTVNPLLATPDGFFVVEVTTTEPEPARRVERFLDLVYRADADLARALLMEAKWSTAPELVELAYRWRSGRTADLGFVPYHEAVGIYAYVDPRTVHAGEGREPGGERREAGETAPLPAVFVEPLAEETFLGRALAALDDPALLDDVTAALVVLLNRVLSADRVALAEPDVVRAAVVRARDTLSVGLEYLTDAQVERAPAVLAGVALHRVFRAGHSLTLELRRLASQLRARGVDDPDLDPLLAPRPELPGALDQPPRAGSRPFRSLDDVRRTAAWLGGLGGRVGPPRR